MISVRFSYDGVNRRVKMDKALRMEELKNLIRFLFKFDKDLGIIIQYEDESGKQHMIRNDTDLANSLCYFEQRNKSCLHLFVRPYYRFLGDGYEY